MAHRRPARHPVAVTRVLTAVTLIVLLALAAQVATSSGWSGGPVPAARVTWPTKEQDVVLKSFHFRDGETLPEVAGGRADE